MLFKVIFILIVSFSINFSVFSQDINFQEAKKIARVIWGEHRIDMYCNCKFDKQLNALPKSCAYDPGNTYLGYKITWEHIVPVSWFGHQRACWRQDGCLKKNGNTFGGRQCCDKSDPEFRKMETDLHNLIPVMGNVNKARSNYRFADLNVNDKNFYGCEIQIDENLRAVEPRDEVKGLIARAHLYMQKNYPFKLSKKQQILFQKWNKAYPPSIWEKEWNVKVKQIQGTDNMFISGY